MAEKALDAKAEDVVILDLRKLSFSFDFFVVCSAASDRRMQTVSDNIRESLNGHGERGGHGEGGKGEGGWVLLDYGSVVCHIFQPEVREFYGIERLWADAPHVSTASVRRR